MKHDRCRKACTKAMRMLREALEGAPGSDVKITIELELRFPSRRIRKHEARWGSRLIWRGEACCKWRAKEIAAKKWVAQCKERERVLRLETAELMGQAWRGRSPYPRLQEAIYQP